MMYKLARLLVTVAAAVLAGCGLVDTSITDFDISLPEKSVSLDADAWQIGVSGVDCEGDTQPKGCFPAVPCSSGTTTCEMAESEFCSGDECSASCTGTNCQVEIDVTLVKSFDLASDNDSLNGLEATSAIKVSIDGIFFDVPINTLNVETPLLDVYLAPENVVAATHASAQFIGSIPRVDPLETVDGGEMVLDAGAQAVFRSHLEDWSTPFNVIVTGTVSVRANDPIPSGKSEAIVRVEATASIL